MKPVFVKCEYCKADMGEKATKCTFAIHKRVIGDKEYYFCCKNHADRFTKEKEKKKK